MEESTPGLDFLFQGRWRYMMENYDTFEKCSILFKLKEDENFNHRNTLSILRIKI